MQTIPVKITAIRCQEAQPLHSMEYLLVLPLNEGVTLTGAEVVPVHQGVLLFLSPFSPKRLELNTGSSLIYAAMSPTFFEGTVGLPRQSCLIFTKDEAMEVTEKLIELFDLQYNQENTTYARKMALIYDLLCVLEPVITNSLSPTDSTESSTERKNRMLRYMEENFRHQIQLCDLAETIGVSRQHVSMIFHKEIGETFFVYLQNLRLKESVRLLLATDKSISTVAEESGFPNIKGFNQIFKRTYNMTPKEYRQKHTKKIVSAATSPTDGDLQSVKRLLQRYRMVYAKSETTIRLSETVSASIQEPHGMPWTDMINIDSCNICLHSAEQAAFRELHKKMHFKYVRLGNLFSDEMMRYIPLTSSYRMKPFLQVIDFFRDVGVTPMLAFGDKTTVALDEVLTDDDAYSNVLEGWHPLLENLIDASVERWGQKWVSTWRFEFRMPSRLYGSEDPAVFIDLFESSANLIHSKLPNAEIGGPAIPLDQDHMPRWNAWLNGVSARNIPISFVSMELWANYTIKKESFIGYYHEWLCKTSVKCLENADYSLPLDKVASVRQMLSNHGLAHLKLYISALGITKYQAGAAQVGGHCSAYLVKTAIALQDLVDGIGCWKFRNSEAEYPDDTFILGHGCGLASRYDLKNPNWYAYWFLFQLYPRRVYCGPNAMITADGQGNYAIIIHNCKNYSSYFYKHYLDKQGMQFLNARLYTSYSAIHQTLRMKDLHAKKYMVRQYLIGDHHGCIAHVVDQIGAAKIYSEDEIAYIAGQSLPYQRTFEITAEDCMELSATVQPNEVMLLMVSPKDRDR